jgi:WS/DGAT/MGAT family acyltransferase
MGVGLAAERMSRVDTAWLRMDTEANLMLILGVWMMRPGIRLAQLRERAAERLLRYPRFRQKVVEDELGAQWVEVPGLDLRRHVLAERLKRRRGQSAEAALQARVAELASTALDPDQPLWQLHLIEDFEGGSALIARLHHCIADGVALIGVMLSFADGGVAPPAAAASRESEADWLAQLLKPLSTAAHLGPRVISDVAALALMADDSPTRLKGRAGPLKRVAWGPGLPLDAVRAVSRAMGVTVNDVLLSCVAGALGAYLRARGDATEGQEVRAMVPVNLRRPEQSHELGNRFGLVPLVLPIGIANPVKRLYAVHARMRSLKGSLQPVLAFGLLSIAGLLIKPVQQAMLGIFARKATAVMTNVPGPAQALHFCGATVERVMFWVPQSGDIGVGVSILSYAGQVQFGLITDAGLCPDPEAVVAQFEPEFQQLLMLALMLPWDEPP